MRSRPTGWRRSRPRADLAREMLEFDAKRIMEAECETLTSPVKQRNAVAAMLKMIFGQETKADAGAQ